MPASAGGRVAGIVTASLLWTDGATVVQFVTAALGASA